MGAGEEVPQKLLILLPGLLELPLHAAGKAQGHSH